MSLYNLTEAAKSHSDINPCPINFLQKKEVLPLENNQEILIFDSFPESKFIQICASKHWFKNDQLVVSAKGEILPIKPLKYKQVIQLSFVLCQKAHSTISKETKDHFYRQWIDPQFRKKIEKNIGQQKLEEYRKKAKADNNDHLLKCLSIPAYCEKYIENAGKEELKKYDKFLQSDLFKTPGPTSLAKPVFVYELFHEFLQRNPNSQSSIFNLFGSKVLEISYEHLFDTLKEWGIDNYEEIVSKEHLNYLKKQAHDTDFFCKLSSSQLDIESLTIEFNRLIAKRFCPQTPEYIDFYRVLLEHENKFIPIHQENYDCVSTKVAPKIDLTVSNKHLAQLSSIHDLFLPCDDLINILYTHNAFLHEKKTITLEILESIFQKINTPKIELRSNFFSIPQVFLDLAGKVYHHQSQMSPSGLLRIMGINSHGFRCPELKTDCFYPVQVFDDKIAEEITRLYYQKQNPVETIATTINTLIILSTKYGKSDQQIAIIWEKIIQRLPIDNKLTLLRNAIRSLKIISATDEEIQNAEKNYQSEYEKAVPLFYNEIERLLQEDPKNSHLFAFYQALQKQEKFSSILHILQLSAFISHHSSPLTKKTVPVNHSYLIEPAWQIGSYFKIFVPRQNRLIPKEKCTETLQILANTILPEHYEFCSKELLDIDIERTAIDHLECQEPFFQELGYQILLYCQASNPHELTIRNLYTYLPLLFNTNSYEIVKKAVANLIKVDPSSDIPKNFSIQLEKNTLSEDQMNYEWISALISSSEKDFRDLAIKNWRAFINAKKEVDSKSLQKKYGLPILTRLRKKDQKAALQLFYDMQIQSVLEPKKELELFTSLAKGCPLNWSLGDLSLLVNSLKQLLKYEQADPSKSEATKEIVDLITWLSDQPGSNWSDLLHDSLRLGFVKPSEELQSLFLKHLNKKLILSDIPGCINLWLEAEKQNLWNILSTDKVPKDFYDFCLKLLLNEKESLKPFQREIVRTLCKNLSIKNSKDYPKQPSHEKILFLLFSQLSKSNAQSALKVFKTILEMKILEVKDQLETLLSVLIGFKNTNTNKFSIEDLRILYDLCHEIIKNAPVAKRHEHSLIGFLNSLLFFKEFDKVKDILLLSQAKLLSCNSVVKDLWVEILNHSLTDHSNFQKIWEEGSRSFGWTFTSDEHTIQKKFFNICSKIFHESSYISLRNPILENLLKNAKNGFKKNEESLSNKPIIHFLKQCAIENVNKTPLIIKNIQALKRTDLATESIYISQFLDQLESTNNLQLTHEDYISIYDLTLNFLNRTPSNGSLTKGFVWIIEKLNENKLEKNAFEILQKIIKTKFNAESVSLSKLLIQCLIHESRKQIPDFQQALKIWKYGMDQKLWDFAIQCERASECFNTFIQLILAKKMNQETQAVFGDLVKNISKLPQDIEKTSIELFIYLQFIQFLKNNRLKDAGELLRNGFNLLDTAFKTQFSNDLLEMSIKTNFIDELIRMVKWIFNHEDKTVAKNIRQTLLKECAKKLISSSHNNLKDILFCDRFLNQIKESKDLDLLICSLVKMSQLADAQQAADKARIRQMILDIHRMTKENKTEKLALISNNTYLELINLDTSDLSKEVFEILFPHVLNLNSQFAYHFVLRFQECLQKDQNFFSNCYEKFLKVMQSALHESDMNLSIMHELLWFLYVNCPTMENSIASFAQLISIFMNRLLKESEKSEDFHQPIREWVNELSMKNNPLINLIPNDLILKWIHYFLDNSISGRMPYLLLEKLNPSDISSDLYPRCIKFIIENKKDHVFGLEEYSHSIAQLLSIHKEKIIHYYPNEYKDLVYKVVVMLKNNISEKDMIALFQLLSRYEFIENSILFPSKVEYADCIKSLIPTNGLDLFPILSKILIELNEPEFKYLQTEITRSLIDQLIHSFENDISIKNLILFTSMANLKNNLFYYYAKRDSSQNNQPIFDVSIHSQHLVFEHEIQPYEFIFSESIPSDENDILKDYHNVFSEFASAGAIFYSVENFQGACQFIQKSIIKLASKEMSFDHLIKALLHIFDKKVRHLNKNESDTTTLLDYIKSIREDPLIWNYCKENPSILSKILMTLAISENIMFYYEGIKIFYKILDIPTSNLIPENAQENFNIDLAKIHYDNLMNIWPLIDKLETDINKNKIKKTSNEKRIDFSKPKETEIRSSLARMIIRNIAYILECSQDMKTFLVNIQQFFKLTTRSKLDSEENQVTSFLEVHQSYKTINPANSFVSINDSALDQFVNYFESLRNMSKVKYIEEPNLMRLLGTPLHNKRMVLYLTFILEETQHIKTDPYKMNINGLIFSYSAMEFLLRRYPQYHATYFPLITNSMFNPAGFTQESYLFHLKIMETIFGVALNFNSQCLIQRYSFFFYAFQLFSGKKIDCELPDEKKIVIFNDMIRELCNIKSQTLFPCYHAMLVIKRCPKIPKKSLLEAMEKVLSIVNENPFVILDKNSKVLNSPLLFILIDLFAGQKTRILPYSVYKWIWAAVVRSKMVCPNDFKHDLQKKIDHLCQYFTEIALHSIKSVLEKDIDDSAKSISKILDFYEFIVKLCLPICSQNLKLEFVNKIRKNLGPIIEKLKSMQALQNEENHKLLNRLEKLDGDQKTTASHSISKKSSK